MAEKGQAIQAEKEMELELSPLPPQALTPERLFSIKD
jgi:hypothetical protein